MRTLQQLRQDRETLRRLKVEAQKIQWELQAAYLEELGLLRRLKNVDPEGDYEDTEVLTTKKGA